MHTLFPISHLVAALTMVSSALAGRKILYPLDIVGLEPAIMKEHGYDVFAITENEWRKMSASDFSAFDAIVIGDHFCATEIPSFIKETVLAWAPAINGNIMVAGNAPSDAAQRGAELANEFVAAAIDFAADVEGATGLYYSLSCYYKGQAGEPQLVEELSYFGPFFVYGSEAPGPRNVHTEAWHPTLEGVSEDVLSEWRNSSGYISSHHEYFYEYPASGALGFEVFAIVPTNDDHPMAVLFLDGTSGLPYILTRGAIPRFCGDGTPQKLWDEECDEGSEINGKDGSLCNRSCKCKYGIVFDWKNKDPNSGTWVTSCNEPVGWKEKYADYGPWTGTVGGSSLSTSRAYRNDSTVRPTRQERIKSETMTAVLAIPLPTDEARNMAKIKIITISTSMLPKPSGNIIGVEVMAWAEVVETVNEGDDKSITKTNYVSTTTRALVSVDDVVSALNLGGDPIPIALPNEALRATPTTTNLDDMVISAFGGLGGLGGDFGGIGDQPISVFGNPAPIPATEPNPAPISTTVPNSTPISTAIPNFTPISTIIPNFMPTPTTIIPGPPTLSSNQISIEVDLGLGEGWGDAWLDQPISIFAPGPNGAVEAGATGMTTVVLPTEVGDAGAVSECVPMISLCPVVTFDGAASPHGLRAASNMMVAVVAIAAASGLWVAMIWT